MSKQDDFTGATETGSDFPGDLLEQLPVTKEENDVINVLAKVRRRASNEDTYGRDIQPCVATNQTEQKEVRAGTTTSTDHALTSSFHSTSNKTLEKETDTVAHPDHLAADLSGVEEDREAEDEDMYIEKFFATWDNAQDSTKKDKRAEHEMHGKGPRNGRNNFVENVSYNESSFSTVESYRFGTSETPSKGPRNGRNSFVENVSYNDDSFSTLESYRFGTSTRTSFSSACGRKRPSLRRPSTTRPTFQLWNRSNDLSYAANEDCGSSVTRSSFSAFCENGKTTNKAVQFCEEVSNSIAPLGEGGNGNLRELSCFGKMGRPGGNGGEGGTRRRISVTSDLTESTHMF